MSQETNLKFPYFDDYDEPVIEEKQTITIKFFSVSGYPVQARELTTLQSILQNQVEQFGKPLFQRGCQSNWVI